MRGSSKTQLSSSGFAGTAVLATSRKSPKARASSREAADAVQRATVAATLSPVAPDASPSELSDPRLVGTGRVAFAR